MATVTHQISSDTLIGYWKNSAEAIGQSMAEAGAGGTLEIIGSNGGGDLMDAMETYNKIKSFQAAGGTVNVTITGYAASAYTLLALAADSTKAYTNSVYLPHNCLSWVDVFGYFNKEEIDEVIQDLEAVKLENAMFDGLMVDSYARKSGMKAEEVSDILAIDTWMVATKALEYGFIDEILDAIAIVPEVEDNEVTDFEMQYAAHMKVAAMKGQPIAATVPRIPKQTKNTPEDMATKAKTTKPKTAKTADTPKSTWQKIKALINSVDEDEIEEDEIEEEETAEDEPETEEEETEDEANESDEAETEDEAKAEEVKPQAKKPKATVVPDGGKQKSGKKGSVDPRLKAFVDGLSPEKRAALTANRKKKEAK